MDYAKIPTMTFGDQIVLRSVEFPQANDLDKVFAVLGLLSDGHDMADAIAAGLSLVEREGHYYAAAACALRLVKKGEGSTGVTYELTESGGHWLSLPEDERKKLQTRLTLDCPHVKLIAFELGLSLPLSTPVPPAMTDSSSVEPAVRALPGLANATVRRRASTIASWMRRVNQIALESKAQDGK
jgi:hypothetical protein